MTAPIDRKSPRPRLVFVRLGIFGLLVLTACAFLVWAGADWKQWIERLTHLHPAAFLGAMSLLPVVGFPIGAFYFLAGVVYGWKVGIPLCLAALAVNMSLSYAFTQTFLRAPLLELVQWRGLKLPQVTTTANQFRMTFLLRTIPGPPYALQNYLLALTGIPFKIYLPVSLFGQGIIGSAVIVAANLLSLRLEPWTLIVGAAVFSLLGGLIGSLLYARRERQPGTPQNASKRSRET